MHRRRSSTPLQSEHRVTAYLWPIARVLRDGHPGTSPVEEASSSLRFRCRTGGADRSSSRHVRHGDPLDRIHALDVPVVDRPWEDRLHRRDDLLERAYMRTRDLANGALLADR